MSEFSYICPQDECTGCMACINACAHSSINIIQDSLGFRYPVINTSTCTNCGLCYRVCPQLNRRKLDYPKKCYAGISKNEDDQQNCSSGGFATVLSRAVIKEGGLVVGCSGQDIHNVHHVIIDSIDNIDQLRGSKYVQSLISETLFKDIRKHLLSGRTVLFIGTGCQVAGLKNFLIKDYPNLITVDLVCHGVPSQQMLDDDLNLYPGIKNNTVKFRKKVRKKVQSESDGASAIRFGLNAERSVRIGASSKPFWIPWYKDPYLGSFMSCVNFRDGCYKCLYASPERQSDITICDFWGLGKDSKLYSKTGVSAILINSIAGDNIFNRISSELDFEAREIEEAVRGNGQLMHPSEENKFREEFIEVYKKNGIRSAYRKTVYLSMIKKHIRSKLIPILYPIYHYIKKLLK